MAATVSAWAKPGAWALDSEENEAELLQKQKEETNHKSDVSADFPSLAAAAATKSKKKKGQTLSLAEFSNLGSGKSVQTSQAKGLTPEDLKMLPTGPRERTAEELDRSRLGGGFRSYGSNGYDRNRYSNGDDSSNPRWGSSRDSDEPRRQGGFGRDSNRELAPSRADENDDWAAGKKSTFGNGFERRERGDRGGFFDSQSRADESDNWVSNKNFVPSEGRRFGSAGGAFDSLRERRGGFESNGSGSDSDNWVKKKEEEGRNFAAIDSNPRDRRGGFELGMNGGADLDNWGKKREEGSGSGRPRLNLKPRTLPVDNGQENGSGSPAKPKGSNPFGQARPREEVLKEKGQDWKEIEEKLDSMKIKEMVSSGTVTTDGAAFGKRSFGGGNGRAIHSEGRSWRKTDSIDFPSSSGEKIEDELVGEEAEGRDLQDAKA